MDIDRKNLVRVEDQIKKGWGGWMKDWMGLGDKSISATSVSTTATIASKIEQAMTPEEKSKLFDAIDYQVSLVVLKLFFYRKISHQMITQNILLKM